jgi:S-DNA-T family DNA segregation ATPase FtsK/SpoIIIE
MTARNQLEFQSDRIEMVLASYKAPARVTGGVVTPRAVQFHLAPASGTRINKVQALAEELALALGVVSVRVSRQGSSVQLEIPRGDAKPVKLLSLMARLGPAWPIFTSQVSSLEKRASPPSNLRLPPGTAVLGLCDDGAPLLIRLPSPDVAHVLISGTTGSGKTALCQTLILSLAMTHRRSQLQFVLIDPKRRAFTPFASLPHLLWPIVGDAADAVDALSELVRLMEMRGSGGIKTGRQGDEETDRCQDTTPSVARCISSVAPRIVIVLDELADLMQVGGRMLGEHLTRLAQRGREAGIHVIASTQKPSSQVLGTLTRANFPVRLVGKVVSPEDARVAAGVGGTGAEKLVGRGDFIAVAAGQVLRFQAAYISAAEMQQVVAQLGSEPRRWDVMRGRPSLLHQAVALMAQIS